MSSAEELAMSLQFELRGIHALIWDDQYDLVRALLILRAAASDLQLRPMLVPTTEKELAVFCNMLYDSQIDNDVLRVLFVPQAANAIVGPWLNGARRPLSRPPGTLLLVRDADFKSFQEYAPDLASFVGPRIYDSASMLSIASPTTTQRLEATLPDDFMVALRGVPGSRPTRPEIDSWLATLRPSAS